MSYWTALQRSSRETKSLSVHELHELFAGLESWSLTRGVPNSWSLKAEIAEIAEMPFQTQEVVKSF